MKSLLEMMQWRFACKNYDQGKKIAENDLREIMEATRLTPSSFGLQTWKFIVVTNQELKQQLASACYNQPQITESAALVVLCSRNDVLDAAKEYMEHYKAEMGRTDEEIKGFRDMVEGMISSRPAEVNTGWSQKQVYLAGETLMVAAAEKEIDSCPMEGFNPAEVAKTLNLPANLSPTLLVSLGYRTAEAPKKVRFAYDKVVELRN